MGEARRLLHWAIAAAAVLITFASASSAGEGTGEVDPDGTTPLHWAVLKNDLETVQREAGRLDQFDRGGRGAGRKAQVVVDDVAD